MFRKLLVPLAATALLAGCVTTAPYGYRGEGGDYYYGAPSVEYRYHGVYGDPYSYGPYRPGLSVWGGYGYPYYGGRYSGYPYPYYGYPYYGNPYYGRPYHPRPTPGPEPGDAAPPRPKGGPWRNLDDLVRRRRAMDGDGAPVAGAMPVAPPRAEVMRPPVEPRFSPTPMPRMDRDEGSGAGAMIRRARAAGTQED